MEGKELLKRFIELTEHQQNKILVDAYKQIDSLHKSGKSFDSFTWRDCRLENDELTIAAGVDNYFNEESLQRNLVDYAGVVYCLATGRTSAESMSWDGGRKIESAVLREVVLTICGRNYSVKPLIEKLKHPYTDEDSFFEGYSTVDEKEAAEAYKKQQEIDRENRIEEGNERNREFFSNQPSYTSSPKPWYTKWWYFLILFLLIGGARACKYSKSSSHRQAVQHHQSLSERDRQIRQQVKDIHLDLESELKRNAPVKSNGDDQSDE